MAKRFVVRIGLADYVIESIDAITLLEIASRMKQVKRPTYSSPYIIEADQEPWVKTINMAEVIEDAVQDVARETVV